MLSKHEGIWTTGNVLVLTTLQSLCRITLTLLSTASMVHATEHALFVVAFQAHVNFFGSCSKKKSKRSNTREPSFLRLLDQPCANSLTSLNVIIRAEDHSDTSCLSNKLPNLKRLFYVTRNPVMEEIEGLRMWSTSGSCLKVIHLDICYEPSFKHLNPEFASEIAQFGECLKRVSISLLYEEETKFSGVLKFLLRDTLPDGLDCLSLLATVWCKNKENVTEMWHEMVAYVKIINPQYHLKHSMYDCGVDQKVRLTLTKNFSWRLAICKSFIGRRGDSTLAKVIAK